MAEESLGEITISSMIMDSNRAVAFTKESSSKVPENPFSKRENLPRAVSKGKASDSFSQSSRFS